MILQVEVEIPADESVAIGNGETIYRAGVLWKVGDSEVRDPAVGVIGNVLAVHDDQRAGRRYLKLTIEIDDKAAVSAATRRSPVF